MAFKFIRTGTGELSGPSMIYQIEQGFDDTAAFVEEVHKTAENAEATANKALEEATEATSVANVALKTAQDAQASAEAAQNRADEAWNAATGGGESAEAAMQRANAAYELADTANANALSAQSKADAATTAAEEATTAASTATTAATEATATANEAISKAGTAEFAANQASSDVRMLKSIIDGLENAANEFEADSYTTSLDSLVSALVKKYMTGAITSALPDGVSAPFWFYNWSTSDLAKVFQFIQTNTGSYGRIGTPSGITMRDGEDTFYIQFKSGTSTSATSVAISCADNALTAAGQHGFTWTATSTPARGLVGTLAWDATTPDGTEITIGNRVVATVTGGNVVVSDFSPSPSTNATLALTGGTITTSSTTLEISFVWTSLDASGCTWDAWNAMLGGIPLIEAGDDGKALVADGETLTWVKGPSFTETPAAGAVPKADASGKLNAWVDVPTPWSPGDIKMWFGELDATGKYPLINGVANTSWHICDGTGGTPDMRDRVPVGASASKAKGTTGGSETHDHAVSVTVAPHAATSITGSVASAYSGVSSSTASASTSGTVGSTTLSTSQMPSHSHKLEESAGTIPSGNLGAYGVLIPNTSARGTHATGGSGSHTHSLSGGSHSHSISESTHTHGAGTLKTPDLSHSASGAATSTEALPPYVALHFLMYVG